jgi:nucleotide-binding universal stress UspA family protein
VSAETADAEEALMLSSVSNIVEFGARGEAMDPLLRSAARSYEIASPPILVVTDGSRESGAAIRVSAAMTARDNRPIEAVVVAGRMGPTIARAARECGASLIVMGLTREGLASRLLGSGAVARVLQSAQTPVLAVPATARALPRAAVAAIDFSPASLHAAREVRDLLVRPGRLHLVYIRPSPPATGWDVGGWDAAYEAGVAIKLGELTRELTTEGITVVPRIESGSVPDSLLRVAYETKADVIACGNRNANIVERHLLGHVPLQLMLAGERSVLMAP